MAAELRGDAKSVMEWLVGRWQWPAACLFAAGVLLLMMPVWAYAGGTALALVALQLPMYMIHEFEEHTGDRFRLYMNRVIGDGREVLTPAAAFWINAVGVWGLELVALYLAAFVDLSLGLVAFYLPLVNAATHIREAVVRREYNPGLCTAVVLFVPLAGWGLYAVSIASAATWVDHAAAVGVAIGLHAAIIAYLVVRIRRLRAPAAV